MFNFSFYELIIKVLKFLWNFFYSKVIYPLYLYYKPKILKFLAQPVVQFFLKLSVSIYYRFFHKSFIYYYPKFLALREHPVTLFIVRWFVFFLKFLYYRVFYIIYLRFKFNIQEDKHLLREFFSFLKDYPWESMVSAFSLWDWIVFFFFFILKAAFWWPFLLIYRIFVHLVTYLFVLWDSIFLDFLFPFIEQIGGKSTKIYRIFYKIYRIGRWIERVISNFFGITLIWEWIFGGPLAHYSVLIFEAVGMAFAKSFVYVCMKWSAFFDYVVTWFNPYTYRKTRYYLSYKFRALVKYYISMFFLERRQDLTRFYRSFVYFIKRLFYYLKFFFKFVRIFFKKTFIHGQWLSFLMDYWIDFCFLLRIVREQFLLFCWLVIPGVLAFFLSIYYKLWRIITRFFLFFAPFLINSIKKYRWTKIKKDPFTKVKDIYRGKWIKWKQSKVKKDIPPK